MNKLSYYLVVFHVNIVHRFSGGLLTPVPLMTDVVMEVSSIYNTKCVEILIHKNLTNSELENYYPLMKSLTGKQITKVYDMEEYYEAKGTENDLSRTKCFRPVRVTIGNELSRVFFEKVSNWSGNAISKPVSLVFMNTSLESYFRNVLLPFNLITIGVKMLSEEIMEIYEVFRVDSGFPMRVHRIGNWSIKTGLYVTPRTVFGRRYNFEGKVLRAGSIEKWPLSTFRGVMEKDEIWSGLYCKVWNELERLLNFRSIHFRDKHIGIQGEDGTWNGLMNKLLKDEIDVIVADIKMTKPRLSVLDFTYPLISSWYQIYYRQPGYRLRWSAVFEPFSYDVWLAIVGWVTVGTICFYVSYQLCSIRGLETNNEKLTVIESFFFMIRTISLQDYNRIPTTLVCRTIFLMAYVAAAVLIPAYSASLISFLTQHAPVRPFDSLEGLLHDGTYKLLVEENTSEYAYFSRASDRTLRKINDNLVRPIPTIHYQNFSSYGLEMICEHGKLALFEVQQHVRMKNADTRGCKLLSLTQSLTKVDEGIAFAKGDPYSMYIHHHVHRMTEAGLIRRIRRKVTASSLKSHSNWNPVKVEEVFQIFSFLMFGMMVSVVILLIERAYAAFQMKERAKINRNRVRGSLDRINYNFP